MLRRLRIKNFKLLRDVELTFQGDVPVVLIGANSAGKSTVIEVLDFLSRCATDGLESALVAHGGMTAVRTIGVEAPIEIESVWGDSQDTLTWMLRFDVSRHGAIAIEAETIRHNGRLVVDTTDDGQRRAFDDQLPEAAPALIKGRHKLAFEALVDPERYQTLENMRFVAADIRVIGALSALPRWARATVERLSARDAMVVSTERFVGREGVGLVTALYNLQTHHAAAWDQLQRALKGEFPFVRRIVFPADPGGARISFAIEDERFPGKLVFASELSDGLVTFLCLLSLILHPEQFGALALDEPDAHLHPSAVRRLLALAHERHAFARSIIIVTHSNAVLEELVDPAASIRVVEATAAGARIRQLDAEALAAWRGQYTMSELRQTGLLDPSNSSYGTDE